MRVLLVEDDTMIGEVVLDALRAEHYATDWVKDGAMAETALATAPYDLVLLDLGLPGRDGLDVLARIRASDSTIPLLIITARDGLDARLRGLDGGATRLCRCWRVDRRLRPYSSRARGGAVSSQPPQEA